MHDQQPIFGEMLPKLEMAIALMPCECGVCISRLFPQHHRLGTHTLKSHLIHLPTLN